MFAVMHEAMLHVTSTPLHQPRFDLWRGITDVRDKILGRGLSRRAASLHGRLTLFNIFRAASRALSYRGLAKRFQLVARAMDRLYIFD